MLNVQMEMCRYRDEYDYTTLPHDPWSWYGSLFASAWNSHATENGLRRPDWSVTPPTCSRSVGITRLPVGGAQALRALEGLGHVPRTSLRDNARRLLQRVSSSRSAYTCGAPPSPCRRWLPAGALSDCRGYLAFHLPVSRLFLNVEVLICLPIL